MRNVLLAMACICAISAAQAPIAAAASIEKLPSYYDKDGDDYITGFDYVKMGPAEQHRTIVVYLKIVLKQAGQLDEVGEWDCSQVALRLKPYIDKLYADKSERDLNVIGAVREAINNQ